MRTSGNDLTFLARGSFRIGDRWIYLGRPKECNGCQQEEFCHLGLRPTQIFTVLQDKKTRIYCKIRDQEVTTVKVKMEILTAFDLKSVRVGAIMRYEPVKCNALGCSLADFCLMGVPSGSSIKVDEIIKSVECLDNPQRRLVLARVSLYSNQH